MNLKLKHLIRKTLLEMEGSDFTLAPDIIGSVNNVNVKDDSMMIDFSIKDGRKAKLVCPIKGFRDFESECEDKSEVLKKFLVSFFSNSSPVEDTIDEIIDEEGDIIGDKDIPNNSTNRMVGKSKFGTDRAIKQMVAPINKFQGPFGLGFVVW
jgi:hypothetical protein